jgi:predicted ATPase/DNA-binding winged helix-turn-helix (wHTH) protein
MVTDPAALEFGPFRLLVTRRELLAHGIPVSLGQRAFDVLLALVRRSGQLVTKDELLAEVWPGVVVEENNLQAQVSALRKVFKAAADGERYLLTVAGRGYRFVAPVHTSNDRVAGAQSSSDAAEAAPAPNFPVLTNLPQPLTRLIGRDGDLGTVKARLGEHRLVTLTGAGGIGKTRLAIETGTMLKTSFADGVWFVELAPLNDPQLVLPVIAEVLRGSAGGAKLSADELVETLGNKRLLLLIDNCEHVVAEVSRAVDLLLRKCPRMSILASSREPLAISGENLFRVPSLPTPDAAAPLTGAAASAYPAVQLFVERAGALGIDLELDDDNAAIVSSICRRLDGIPLAIELAAPRLKVLSLQQLARGLDDRFRLLTGGPRTALPRQQTLRALIDWSYGLLTGAEQLFLRRLSIFGCDANLASITAVVADGDEIMPEQILDLLSSLIEKSLIVADLAGGEPRYRMMESTRYYAREKLAEVDEAEMRARHAHHFSARFAEASDAWDVTSSQRWIASYAADIDNVRAALEWAFGPKGDVAAGLALVGRSHVLWAELGLMFEHRHWVEEALRLCTAKTPRDVLARLLSWQAGDVKEIDDPTEYEDAMRAAAIYRKLGDRFSEGKMILRAGMARLLPDNAEDGERLLRDAQALLAPYPKTKSLARCLSALATERLLAADVAAAHELHSRAVRIYEEIGEFAELPDRKL